MKYDLKLSKRVAQQILNIVGLAKQSDEGYWCHEIAVHNQSVALRDRDLVNALVIQVLDGKLPKSEMKCFALKKISYIFATQSKVLHIGHL